jgi:acetyl/propionyl-CoA carboxylase alpha subunit
MRTLFVASRGEIARRITVTALRLGIVPVVPALDGQEAVDLLDPRSVVDAARAAGADAVHPGYGFLAESPDLAAAVLAAGLTWVGPSPAAIRSLGDKAAARAVARRVGVPVADGEEPLDQADAALAAVAGRIGYPVLVKPVAGGGGKGIRVVRAADGLGPALAAARREAARAFGDERLLLERYVEDTRHVEVQVLGDAHGSLVHLGDRDCSLQRRHQKMLEESPAPLLDPVVCQALRAAALRVAAAVEYQGAGTCEFLVCRDGAYVFLEMNARLQVEHPVTELVLGRDLVADQLAIADGATLASLGLGDQAAVEARLAAGGHAIEARLNAEDPAHGFLPSTGRVVAIRWPADATSFGPVGAGGIRVDTAIEEGDAVGGRFDPLLAKVIAHGPDRATALARLAAALDATEVLGLATNLAFLRRLVRLPVVAEARARIETVESDPDVATSTHAFAHEGPPDSGLSGPGLPGSAWEAAGRLLLGGAGPAGAWGGGWRPNLPSRLRLAADAGDGPIELGVDASDGDIEAPPRDPTAHEGDIVHVSVAGASVPFRLAPPPALAANSGTGAGDSAASGGAEVRAPMPGMVVGVHVAVGDVLAAGARIATIEAMKMEHDVTAPGPTLVEELFVHEGDQVERGRLVARLGTVGEGGRTA